MDNWNGIISLLIACIELVIIINLLVFAKKNRINWIVILLLVILMVYQAIEFLICQAGYSSSFLTYLAFADIAFLPALNLYFIYNFFVKENRNLKIIFLIPLMFIVYYAFIISRFEMRSCTVFFAVFNYPHGTLFGVYYYLPVVASVYYLISYLQKGSVRKKVFYAGLFLAGHAIMIIPVLFAFLLSALKISTMLNSIESIMCKFAFGYVLCLTFFALNYKESTDG
jgi:hypothetical protein